MNDYICNEVIRMNEIEKAFKEAIGEEPTFRSIKLLEPSTLEDKIINYNTKLYKIIKRNKIELHNEVKFVLNIKKQISNKELLPLVICFLCDKNYINRLKHEDISSIVKGDIAAYVLLRTNIEKFIERLKYIQKKETLKDSYECKIIKRFYNLESLVASTYENCNCIHISRDGSNHKALYDNSEKYVRCFIYDNLKFKTIDYKIYMKKLSIGDEDGFKYLIDITKKLLRFNEEAFIKEVEHVREFYNLLKKILNEEVDKEFEIIISNYLYNIVSVHK